MNKECPKGGQHEIGTDGMHPICKKCFTNEGTIYKIEWRPEDWDFVRSQQPEPDVWDDLMLFENGASAMLAARDKWWAEGVEPIINSLVEHIRHGDYSNGNTAQGSDEGEYLSAHHVEYLLNKWQSLKQSILEDK